MKKFAKEISISKSLNNSSPNDFRVKSLLMITAAGLLIILLLFCALSIAVVDAQQTQNNATASTTGDKFSFIVNVRGITEYNEDKLAVVITSGDLIEAKLVDRSQAVLPPGESTGPRSVDTEISFPAGSGMKAGDEFQACLLSMGAQYQSVECQYGVLNPPETGPQNIIIPL